MVSDNRSKQLETAGLFAARNMIAPEDRQLADMGNIGKRMGHPLTMVKALVEQIDEIKEQIKDRQKWHIQRWVTNQAENELFKFKLLQDEKLGNGESIESVKSLQEPKLVWTEEHQKEEIARLEKVLATDKLDKDSMFAMDFYKEYLHTSRGIDGHLLGLTQALADAEITNRTADDSMPKPAFREQ